MRDGLTPLLFIWRERKAFIHIYATDPIKRSEKRIRRRRKRRRKWRTVFI